ncbi:MAG: histidine--tRNA ligase [Pseudomonadota bacterium]
MNTIQSVRGMNDVLPPDSHHWNYLEGTVTALLENYGYRELRLPLVEPTGLFARSIGEVTDIVEKEMYTFSDRNGDSLSLRPEGTAGAVRAAIQHKLTSLPGRYYYRGPMFRYERPQKGRQRQFHQIGAEVFGHASPDADAELIVLLARLWSQLGVRERVRLEINSLGSPESRAAYRDSLVAYLGERRELLDEDSQRRLESNPLRILDSKNPDTQALLVDAPSLEAFLDEESRQDFTAVLAILDATGIGYTVNPRLVRGLDYYNKTVFEWVTDALGAQGTVCAGGRYDGLVEQLGGRATAGVGWAMGVERLLLLLEACSQLPELAGPDVFAIAVGDAARLCAFAGVESLREQLSEISISQQLGGGSIKSQLKKADKSGARVALIWGEDEAAHNMVTVKPLRGDGEQRRITMDRLVPLVSDLLTPEVDSLSADLGSPTQS